MYCIYLRTYPYTVYVCSVSTKSEKLLAYVLSISGQNKFSLKIVLFACGLICVIIYANAFNQVFTNSVHLRS